ncbi:sporulation protein YqfD [Brevibacillus fulvus]|uniref:Sporulation protein YqfD n=1 Tax=Brevibacillus fulvus TaxID=1125967 RepID=A0A938Y282_9BACL|nr:sporulation protein YqfD [Brevibacillus fulvus]MBM7589855.1 hypothetical protein [Brevibacillus fulvus]
MRNMMKEWLEGNITIKVRGKRFERLVNMAVREGIHIWNIRRIGTELSECQILIGDYFRLRPLLRETGCRTHVVSRDGLPFWFRRIKARSGFVIGALLFFLGLYMLSSLVWSVEIQGTYHISPTKVGQAAEKIGIKVGAWKAKLEEPQQLQRELLRLLPEASYVGVRLQGTKAIIQVVEKEEPMPKPAVGPRNLVAKKRAVISKVMAEAGKSMVKVNQFVEKGQVLISGVIGNEERQGLVAAKGTVQGEVWYESQVTVPLRQSRYQLTGQQQENHYLLLGSWAVRIWPVNASQYAKAETSEERHQLGLGAAFTLPVGWKTVTLREMEQKNKQLTVEEAVEIGKQSARLDILKRASGDAQIKDEKVLHTKTENGKVYLSIHYTVIEDIAEEQPIVALPPLPDSSENKTE